MSKKIDSLEDYQQKYFPSKVGVECPHCSKPYDYNKCFEWLRERWKVKELSRVDKLLENAE